MTFNSAPWAIDGARTTAALARLATYTTGGGRSGVARPRDLRVAPLEVPGAGLRVFAGGATVLNGYLSDPDEAYVVSNPSTHVITSADMPPASSQVSHYLVCVVIGDPEFDQTGHPFMPSEIAPEAAATFDYVRMVIIPCSASTTSFEELGLNYPAYALARLEIPANTTTITAPMITDLRELAQARSKRDLTPITPPVRNLDSASWTIWPMYSGHMVSVPPWATRANIVATLTNFYVVWGPVQGAIRLVVAGTLGSPESIFQIDAANGQRETMVVAFSVDVSTLAGQDVSVALQGLVNDIGSPGVMQSSVGTQLIFDVEFTEDTL